MSAEITYFRSWLYVPESTSTADHAACSQRARAGTAAELRPDSPRKSSPSRAIANPTRPPERTRPFTQPKVETMTGATSAATLTAVSAFWVRVPAARLVVLVAVSTAITAIARSWIEEIRRDPNETSASPETAGTSTPVNRANATATAAIVPVWITVNIAQPNRE